MSNEQIHDTAISVFPIPTTECPVCQARGAQEEIAKLHRSGITMAEIGRRRGTSRQAVFKSLQRYQKWVDGQNSQEGDEQ